MPRPKEDDEHEIGSRAANAKKVENTPWNARAAVTNRAKQALRLAKNKPQKKG